MPRADVTFDSWGERCAAWLYRPDEAVEPVPCVVMAHGWTGIKEQRLDAFAERFCDAGLAALVFDYRHFGASEGQPRQLLDVGRLLADWASAISYARALEGIDPERIALWGSSFSGGHVLATAARDRRVAAVVSQVPFIDGLRNLRFLGARKAAQLTREGIKDQVAALLGRPPHMLKSVGPPGSVAAMTTPDAEPGFRALTPEGVRWVDEAAARIGLRVGLYRPGRQAREIHCPVLFCVADQDAITPPQLAVEAAGSTPRGELRRYPIGHFDIYIGEWFERAVTDQVEFLTRHLLAGARESAGAAAA
jgi:pimeloyl-ACP methyl ester carboxylesterase